MEAYRRRRATVAEECRLPATRPASQALGSPPPAQQRGLRSDNTPHLTYFNILLHGQQQVNTTFFFSLEPHSGSFPPPSISATGPRSWGVFLLWPIPGSNATNTDTHNPWSLPRKTKSEKKKKKPHTHTPQQQQQRVATGYIAAETTGRQCRGKGHSGLSLGPQSPAPPRAQRP